MSDWLTAAAIVVATLTWFISHRKDLASVRKAAGKALYDDFCSADMLHSRIAADKLLHLELVKQANSDEQLYSQMKPEDWIHISKLLHFFERAEVSIRLGLVDPTLVVALLKKDYRYYWENYFTQMHAAYEQDAQERASSQMWTDLKSLSRRVGCTT